MVVSLTDHDIFDSITADHFVDDDKKALAMEGAYVFFEDAPDAFCSVTRNLQTTKKKYRDATELLKLADLAMYELKRNGKKGYRFSDEAKQRQTKKQLPRRDRSRSRRGSCLIQGVRRTWR